MSLDELADLVGLTHGFMSQLETGARTIQQNRGYAKLIRYVLFGVPIKAQRRARRADLV